MNNDINIIFDPVQDDLNTTLDIGTIQYGKLTIGQTKTGEPGTQAKVENSGSSSNAILNFTIPRGEPGKKGDTGDTGPRGENGSQGPAGKDGAIQYTAGEGIEITEDNIINCTATGSSNYNDLTNKPIVNLTGTSESPIYLKDLTTGSYLVNGTIMPYEGSDISDSLANTLIEIENSTEYVTANIPDVENNTKEHYKVYKNSTGYERTVTNYSNLMEDSTVSTTTRTSITTTLADNINYQCSNALTKLTINFPSERDNHYKSWITFKTESSSINFTCSTPSNWYGLDVQNNYFTPKLNQTYYIEFWQDVHGLNAKVSSNIDYIGNLDALNTSNKSNLVDATNELESKIGNLMLLSTSEKGDLVGAINEVNENILTPDNMGSIIVDDIASKNILDISSFKTQTVNGITITQNYDGSITLNGTSTGTVSVTLNNGKMVLEGDYVFGISSNVINVDIGAYMYSSSGAYKGNINLNNPTANFSNGDYIQTFYIYILEGITINNARIYPQLEKGTIPTNFVKHKTFSVEETDWINADLMNEWQNIGGNYNTVQYKKEGNKVHIRGSIVKNRALSSNDDRIVFNLPAFVRPEKNYFGFVNNQSYNISLVGDVYLGDLAKYASGEWVSLDGLYFFIK